MKWVSNKDCLVVFFEISEELFKDVSSDSQWHLHHDLINKMTYSVGDCALITLIINNGDIKNIRKLFNGSKSKYKKIGFWDRGHKRFFLMKGACHGSNKA